MSLLKQRNGKMRESGIELLRIILMLQVVFLHVCDHGGFTENMADIGSFPTAVFWCVFYSSRTPVYVYMLLLGYFSVSSRSNQTISGIIPKAKKTYFPMLFYSLTIPAVMWLSGIRAFEATALIKAFLPVLSRLWPFMTLYLVVVILSPFLNRCLNNLSKKEFAVLIGILFFIFSIWNMFGNLSPINKVIGVNKVVNTEGGKSLYGYVFMYILGAFIRLHVKKYDKAKWRFLAAFFALAMINAALIYIFPNYMAVSTYNDNPISVIQGACLLLFFRDLKFKSAAINHIALMNLGVYMIHEHPMVRSFLWNKDTGVFKFFHDSGFYTNIPVCFLAAFGVCVAVYAACSIIEQCRRGLFALPGILQRKYKAEKN